MQKLFLWQRALLLPRLLKSTPEILISN